MPWTVTKRGSQFCVIKDSDGTVEGCHSTRAKAEAQQRALYASEASAEEGTVMNMYTDSETTATNGTTAVIGHLVLSDGTKYQVAEAVEEAPVESNLWEGPLGVIGHPTSDKRFLIPEEIGNRELPLPLNVQVQTDEGHDSSLNAGRINTIELIPMGDFAHASEFPLENVPAEAVIVWATGEFDGSPAAEEAKRLIDNGYGVSLDLPPDRIGYFDPETLAEIPADELDEMKVFFGEYLHGIGGQIAGATVVNIPAFSEATIRLAEDMVLVASGGVIHRVLEEDPFVGELLDHMRQSLTDEQILAAAKGARTLVASAAPMKPPADWFRDPGLHELTPLTITDDGRIYGHLADWDGCHTGFTNVCVPPFRSNSNYAYFNTGAIVCDDGSEVAAGKLMFSLEGKGHAPTDPSYGAAEASRFYDDATKIGGFVRAGSDRFGTWLAGVLRSGLSDEELFALRANPPSGDWRPIPGKPGSELVAAFSVPVGGFPIPRMMVASADNGLTIITGPLDLTPGPKALRRKHEVLRKRRKRWSGMTAA